MGDDQRAIGLATAVRRSPDPAFEQTVEKLYKLLQRVDPVQASWLGLHGRHDAHLPEYSREAFDAALTGIRDLLTELDGYDPSHLAPEQETDLILARGFLSTHAALLERRPPWRVMPQAYLEDAVWGVYVLAHRDYAPPDERARSMLGRLREIPGLLRRAMENLEEPPSVFTETAVLCARGAAEFFREGLREFFDLLGSNGQRQQCERAAGEAVEAIHGYRDFLLGALMTRSVGEFRVGKVLFNRMLKDQHRVPFDADELIVLGERFYHETLRQVRATAARIRPGFNWSRLLQQLKEDHPANEGLVAAYSGAVEAARAFVSAKDLLTVPDGDPLDVVLTPAFARPLHPYAMYIDGGLFERAGRGTLWVTPVDPGASDERRSILLEGHSRCGIPVLALHEGFPGHHLQSCLAGRHPRRLRTLFPTPVFSEGWALYCEEMMHEQGFYACDEIRLLQLRDQLWRACRVIADVGLHTGKMSFNDAVGFLVRKAKLERPNAITEVRRYCAHPTQPMSYVVGKLLLLELRGDYEAERGDSFSLREFHDEVLSHGTMPIDLVRREMGIMRRADEKELYRSLTRNARPPRTARKTPAKAVETARRTGNGPRSK